MLHDGALELAVGAVALGAVHGIEPGHGWPVAASYALDQTNKWLYGFAASLIIGIGHLVSSIAMVGVFFYAKDYFDLTQVNEPVTVLGGIQIGGPVSLVAGLLLIFLGIREYRHGHSHGEDGHSHGENEHSHGEDGHAHGENEHSHGEDGHAHGEDGHSHGEDGHSHGEDGHSHGEDWQGQPDGSHEHDGSDHAAHSVAQSGHAHGHGSLAEGADRGLFGIAWFAFVLGFAHEEEFEIIALCAGSEYCLELMTAYALTVIAGIVGLTMLLIAGYHRSEERVRRYTPYLPAVSAVVLSLMGLGFILGLF